MCNIRKIISGKENFLPLLTVADPSIDMIRKYLSDGELYILFSGHRAISAAIISATGNNEFELKNLSTLPEEQKKGYGTILLKKVLELYSDADKIWVGTGSPANGTEFYQRFFYQKLGFDYSHTIRNFFIDNYPDPIYEYNGLQCIDMIYLFYTPSKAKKKR